MNINDFFSQVPKIQELLQHNNYVNLINQLNSNINSYVTTVAQQRQRATNQPQIAQLKNQISTISQQILTTYKGIEAKITNVKIQIVFKQLGLDNINGQSIDVAFEQISKIDNNANQYKNYLAQYYQKISQVNQLNSIANVYQLNNTPQEDLKSDGIAIYFREGVNVEYLNELSKSSTHWNQIIHCFGRLTKGEDNKARIETIEKGSIIMTITATTGIILALTKASNSILDVILKTYEVRKKAIELKSLKLANLKEAIDLLEIQSKLNVKSESERIAKEILAEYNVTDNETQTALFLSIKRIIRFFNKGGKIEPRLLNETAKTNDDLVKSISSKNTLLIDIEAELKKIESNNGILKLVDNTLDSDDNGKSNEK